MAFQPAQRQPRLASAPPPPQLETSASPQVPPQEQVPDDVEWILFSPDNAQLLNREDTASTRTAGRSRLSDFGSLETAAVSDKGPQDEAEDLDSLDDGLHAFSEPHAQHSSRRAVDQSADTVLPAHDGLGTFPGSSSPVQEQFWQHERYNPRRRRYSLRRASLQRKAEAQEEEEGPLAQDDRFQRIERWRMEQSRAILEEIQRETRRRRRRSKLSTSRAEQSTTPTTPQKARSEPEAPLSFWERVTRSIRNLMGIDDATLSFIFGEALPDDARGNTAAEMVAHAEKMAQNDTQLARLDETWEERLLKRIAKELGYLMHHITAHPGAFSTYLKTQEPIPYAGLHTFGPAPDDAIPQFGGHPPSAPRFAPTLPLAHHRRQSVATTDPSLWGIEEEDENDAPSLAHPMPTASLEAERLRRDREYWERDLDVKMVFGYLRSRISPSRSPPPPAGTRAPAATSAQPAPAPARSTPSANTANNPNSSLRRAALIRHHHPLVARPSDAPSAPGKKTTNLAADGPHPQPTVPTPLSPVLGRRHNYEDEGALSSCASQSTNKRSRTGRSNGGGGSSVGRGRNYWDWDFGVGGAGSVGSAGWGEV